MRSAFYIVLCTGMTACTAEQLPLGPGADSGMAAVDAGNSDAGTADVGARDSGAPSEEGCAPWPAELAERSQSDLQALGFRLSDAVVEGRLGTAEDSRQGPRAPLEITKVWVGPAFLEGFTTYVPLDANEASAFRPGEYLVGFYQNAFPIRGDDNVVVWWSKLAIAPSAQRERYADVIALSAHAAPLVASVRIVRQDEDRTTFAIDERIAGELPAEVMVNWGRRTFAAPFPAPSEQRFLASFGYVTPLDDGRQLGQLTDLRADDEAGRRAVNDAITSPLPPLGSERLREDAAQYRQGWTFHRAPMVVATEVTGLADECCTGAGGTYVSHRIEADLRSEGVAGNLVRGGHAYYSEEACGQPFLLGLHTRGLEPQASDFACDMSTWLNTGLEVAIVAAELSGGPEHRERVERWLAADSPRLRIRPAADPRASDAWNVPSDNAPWSELLSVQAGLMVAPLARIRIVSVERGDQGSEVVVATNFEERVYDHLPEIETRLAFRCGDPRLLEPGSVWLTPIVRESLVSPLQSDEALREAAPFLVPGLLFADHDSVKRIASTFASTARRD